MHRSNALPYMAPVRLAIRTLLDLVVMMIIMIQELASITGLEKARMLSRRTTERRRGRFLWFFPGLMFLPGLIQKAFRHKTSSQMCPRNIPTIGNATRSEFLSTKKIFPHTQKPILKSSKKNTKIKKKCKE